MSTPSLELLDACLHEPHRHQPATAVVIDRAATLFRSAGDANRLRLLEILLTGEHCVTELASELGDRMSTVSERLRLLRADGLVARRREGRHVYYALSDDHVAAVLRAGLDHAAELCG
ncbi:MAG: helix-turn-helix transcriptional regulator [Deltaproteobacteria bacterium]|nr:helix-turn-helix transcriptional regulator [Deltaproteobacteria bacterium]